MDQAIAARTPAHLYLIGGAATLWNAFGAYDYLMTRTRNMEYLTAALGADAEAVLAYIDSFPIWAQIGWGLGVWGGLAGSLLLIVKHRLAIHAFALSLLGMVMSFAYQYLGAAGPAIMQEGPMRFMPLVIMAIGAGLLGYSVQQLRRGVLG